ncbi:MAG: endonuclease/exonuclease/phosphatase family protein [Candidatus Hodarchaeales archaeon]
MGFDPDWKNVVEEENADIIMFVETGNWEDESEDGFDHVDFESLVSELNGYFPDELPYVAYTTQNIPYSTSGEAIFSRFPVIDVNQINTVTLDDSTTFWPSHDFLDAEVNVSGVNIHVIGAHLKCCSGEDNEIKREKAQEGINNYMDDLGKVPIIYLGDLNSFSPQDTGDLAPVGDLGTGPVSMLIDPNNPRACEDHVFSDVYRTLNPDDPGFTYPDLKSRIDFIFVNEFLDEVLINSTVGDTASAKIASDHYSVDAYLYPSEVIQTEITTTTTSTTVATTESTTTTTEPTTVTTDNPTSTSSNNSTPWSLLAFVTGLLYLTKKKVK